MLITFTDFGVCGPYLGELHLALMRSASGVPIVDLVNDAPAFDPRASGRLLAALVARIPPAAVVLAVVDPGVGGDRMAVALRADDRWFVGPDNGLLDGVANGARCCAWWEILWRPEVLSRSFHGRDLFAPVAAALVRDPNCIADYGRSLTKQVSAWSPDLAEVIYVDGYGNLVTGLRAETVNRSSILALQGHRIAFGETFSSVPGGTLLWYPNSMGLVEVAENSGNAAERLGAGVGTPVELPDG
jgi:S-adenosylmethionine hydrolase